MKQKNNRNQKKKTSKSKHLMFGLFSYWSLIGLPLGIGGGLAYYFFYGMVRPGCIFHSNPFFTASWGAILGFMVFELFRIITLED